MKCDAMCDPTGEPEPGSRWVWQLDITAPGYRGRVVEVTHLSYSRQYERRVHMRIVRPGANESRLRRTFTSLPRFLDSYRRQSTHGPSVPGGER